jgi:uncharacterized protein
VVTLADVDLLGLSFAAAACAALLAGALRGFSGFGSALVLSPSLSALYGPDVGVPAALLIDLALSIGLVRPALGLADRRRVGVLCAAATLTIPIGAWLLVTVDERTLRWAICAVVVVAVAVLGSGWRYSRRPHAAATASAGVVSGLLTGSTGVAGPPVLFLELSGADPVERLRANFIVYFAWVGAVALAAFAVSGALSVTVVAVSGALVVPYLAAAFVGARLFRRTGEGAYRRLALAVLVAVAVISMPL